MVTTDSERIVVSHLYENLMKLSSDGQGGSRVEAGAARKYACTDNSDGTQTYTFTLRDMKWSDGQKVTAADFVYGAGQAPWRGLYAAVGFPQPDAAGRYRPQHPQPDRLRQAGGGRHGGSAGEVRGGAMNIWKRGVCLLLTMVMAAALAGCGTRREP